MMLSKCIVTTAQTLIDWNGHYEIDARITSVYYLPHHDMPTESIATKKSVTGAPTAALTVGVVADCGVENAFTVRSLVLT